MSKSMGYRATPLPTHKAKEKWSRALRRGRIKRARLERAQAKRHGIVVEQQATT